MDSNNTQFDNALPITVAAARQVGEVLKHVDEGHEIAPRCSFYMQEVVASGWKLQATSDFGLAWLGETGSSDSGFAGLREANLSNPACRATGPGP